MSTPYKPKLEKLLVTYEDGPAAIINGHFIRTKRHGVAFAVLANPIGGIRNEAGHSVSQTAWAQLFAASPDLLIAARRVLGVAALSLPSAEFRALKRAVDKAGKGFAP